VNVVARASFAPVHITLSLLGGEQKRYNLLPEVLANVADNSQESRLELGLCLIRGCREEQGNNCEGPGITRGLNLAR